MFAKQKLLMLKSFFNLEKPTAAQPKSPHNPVEAGNSELRNSGHHVLGLRKTNLNWQWYQFRPAISAITCLFLGGYGEKRVGMVTSNVWGGMKLGQELSRTGLTSTQMCFLLWVHLSGLQWLVEFFVWKELQNEKMIAESMAY